MNTSIKRLILVLFLLAPISCGPMMESEVEKRLTRQHTKWLNDGKLHVVLTGSGGPMVNEDRVASSTAVIAGGEFILVDVGDGAGRAADRQNLPLGSLTAVFLTHFHSDHIADLGELNFVSWATGRAQKLDVYGPRGVEKIVDGFNLVYEQDVQYRMLHHGIDTMNPEFGVMSAKPFSVTDPEEAVLVFDRNGLKAWAFWVDHFPAKPAVGYRFEYRGNVVVLTGDTKKIKTLSRHAKGADILISEALALKTTAMVGKVAKRNNLPRIAKIFADIPDYHMSPVQAAEVAQEAGAKKLVFNHIVPPVINFIAKRMFMDGVDEAFDGDFELGEDGMTFELDPK